MPLRRTRAVVSKTMRMSNSSKLVTLLTERHGLVKVMAKGARRPTSKYGAALEPVTLLECIFYHKDTREIQTLSDADLVESYDRIKDDLGLFTVASCMVEITQGITPVEDPAAGTFDHLVTALGELEGAAPADAEKHLWRYMLRLMRTAGYEPALDACIRCGREPKGGSVFLSFSEGGVICSCDTSHDSYGVTVSPGALKMMRALVSSPAAELPRLKLPQAQKKEVEHVVMQYFSYHVGSSRVPRAMDFMRRLRAGGKG